MHETRGMKRIHGKNMYVHIQFSSFYIGLDSLFAVRICNLRLKECRPCADMRNLHLKRNSTNLFSANFQFN